MKIKFKKTQAQQTNQKPPNEQQQRIHPIQNKQHKAFSLDWEKDMWEDLKWLKKIQHMLFLEYVFKIPKVKIWECMTSLLKIQDWITV